MNAPMRAVLARAQAGGWALAAFNVYTLEAVRAVVGAAEGARAPVALQLHPAAWDLGGPALAAACLAAAQGARVPVVVHLDHAPTLDRLRAGLDAGLRSIMADGSDLDDDANARFVAQAVALAQPYGATVEAELGKLSGTEDGLSIADAEARMTDPDAVPGFVARTGVDALAVCIGNVHGATATPPALDFVRLARIRATTDVPLVLHGASGLGDDVLRAAVAGGVCKVNINTELRAAHVRALHGALCDAAPLPDLVPTLHAAQAAMQDVAARFLRVLGAAGQA